MSHQRPRLLKWFADVAEAVDHRVGWHKLPVPLASVVLAGLRIRLRQHNVYDTATYTRAGMNWIADNTMTTVLLRHYPQLAPALHGVNNPFAPWNVAPPRTAAGHNYRHPTTVPIPDAYPLPVHRSRSSSSSS